MTAIASLVILGSFLALGVADVSEVLRNQNQRQPPFQENFQNRPGYPAIIRQEQNAEPDGRYNWGFETENGISAQEQGGLYQQSGPEASLGAQGSYSYTSPEGEVVSMSYTADENGYQVSGSHLPTPPPTPEAILKALEWIAAHPEENDTK